MLVLLGCWVCLAEAGSFRWTNQGPDGGQLTELVLSPSNELWGLGQGRLFHRDPALGRWRFVPLDTAVDSVSALAFDPQNGAHLYVGTVLGRVLRSTDGGKTFRDSFPGPPAQIFSVAVDPFEPSKVLASVPLLGVGGVFRSNDRGATWLRSGLDGQPAGFLQFDLQKPGHVYATTTGGFGGNVYLSKDGGSTFELLGVVGGPGNPRMLDIGSTATRKNAFYAGTTSGMVKSVDGGRRWLATELGVSASTMLRIGEQLIAGTLRGLYYSTDRGNNWTLRGFADRLQTVQRFNDLVLRGRYLYAATRISGVVRSVDLGETFKDYNHGLRAHRVRSLDVDPVRGHVVVGTDSGAGVYRRDGADVRGRWAPIGRHLRLAEPSVSVVADRQNPAKLYAAVQSLAAPGVRMSEDYGARWLDLSLNVSGLLAIKVGIHPTREGPDGLILLASDGVFRFRQDLNAWIQIFAGTQGTPQVLAFDPQRPKSILLGTIISVYRSDDEGASFVDLSGPIRSFFNDDPQQPLVELRILDIEVDPQDGDKVYVAIGGRSGLGGTLWQSSAGGLGLQPFLATPQGEAFTAVAVRPGRSQELYLGTNFSGVFRTTDGGQTFEDLSQTMSYPRVADLVFDRRAPRTLYAQLLAGGIESYSFGQVTDGEVYVRAPRTFGIFLAICFVGLQRLRRRRTA